jgi:predicted XRE-type DNA-binding protein
MSTRITKSSGNVYADMGYRNADEHALKAEFVRRIAAVMKEQELTQSAAARRLGIEQPDVSKMLRGHFRNSRSSVSCASSWRSVRMSRSSSGLSPPRGPGRRS